MKTIIRDVPPPAAELHREMQETAQALRRAYERFNYVCDPELVDASVFEINSLQAKYNYLLRMAKAGRKSALPDETELCLAASAPDGGGVCLS